MTEDVVQIELGILEVLEIPVVVFGAAEEEAAGSWQERFGLAVIGQDGVDCVQKLLEGFPLDGDVVAVFDRSVEFSVEEVVDLIGFAPIHDLQLDADCHWNVEYSEDRGVLVVQSTGSQLFADGAAEIAELLGGVRLGFITKPFVNGQSDLCVEILIESHGIGEREHGAKAPRGGVPGGGC
jgi:hypothetical protein